MKQKKVFFLSMIIFMINCQNRQVNLEPTQAFEEYSQSDIYNPIHKLYKNESSISKKFGSSLDPDNNLVIIEHENPTFFTFRWLYKGQVTDLGRYLYIYGGEEYLIPSYNEVLKIDNKIVGITIDAKKTEFLKSFIPEYKGKIESFYLDIREEVEIDPHLFNNIVDLAAEKVTLNLRTNKCPSFVLEKLKKLNKRLYALDLNSASKNCKREDNLFQIIELFQSIEFLEIPIEDTKKLTQNVLSNIRILDRDNYPPFDNKTIPNLTWCKNLHVLAFRARDSIMKVIPPIETLRTLDFKNSRITDESLEHLYKFENLRILNLRDTYITEAGLKHLSALPHLQVLNLNNTRIKGDNLIYLPHLDRIRELDLCGTAVNKGNFEYLSKMKNIEVLRLCSYNSNINNKRPWGVSKFISKLNNLRVLDLNGSMFFENEISAFEKLNNIQILKIFGRGIKSKDIRYLSNLKNLVSLDISINDIAEDGMISLSSLTELKRLYLGFMPMDPKILQHLSKLKNLRYLDLRGMYYNRETTYSKPGTFKYFPLLPELRYLNIGENQFTDIEDLEPISRLKKLQQLSFHLNDGLRDKELIHLSRLVELQELDLSFTSITDKGLVHLYELKNLKELRLTPGLVTQKGVRKLQNKIPNCEIHFY